MSVYCIFFSSFQINNRHTVDAIVIMLVILVQIQHVNAHCLMVQKRKVLNLKPPIPCIIIGRLFPTSNKI